MTHIETSIQEDAMKILDVLLEHYPALLAARPAVLLTNFLELISHRQNSGGSNKAQDAKGRTWALSVSLNRAITSQQWRLSVLLRYCHQINCSKSAIYKSTIYIFFLSLTLLVWIVFQTWKFSSGSSWGKTSGGRRHICSWWSVWLQGWRQTYTFASHLGGVVL